MIYKRSENDIQAKMIYKRIWIIALAYYEVLSQMPR